MAEGIEPRLYQRGDCVVFRKTNEEFGGLSNMAGGYPLHINGTMVPSTEALYQSCRFPHQPELQRVIIQQKSPMTAKMKSKPHRDSSRNDWDEVRIRIMSWCLRVKLAQNFMKFAPLLLSTGQRPIVEDSTKDPFWGAIPTLGGQLQGRNVLGRLLMKLREELRRYPDRLSVVGPPKVTDFMLFGEPIGAVQAVIESADLKALVKEFDSKATGCHVEVLQALQIQCLFDRGLARPGTITCERGPDAVFSRDITSSDVTRLIEVLASQLGDTAGCRIEFKVETSRSQGLTMVEQALVGSVFHDDRQLTLDDLKSRAEGDEESTG